MHAYEAGKEIFNECRWVIQALSEEYIFVICDKPPTQGPLGS